MKKTTIWAIAAVLIIVGVIVGVQLSRQDASRGEVTIGAVLPMTGPLAFFGGPEKEALQMAADRVNQNGGVNGRKVNLVIEDSKASAKDGIGAVQKMLISRPTAIITSLTIVTNAVAPVLRDARLPQVALSVHPDIVKQSTYMVRPYYGFEDEMKVLADYVSGKGYKRVGILWIMVPECETAIKNVLTPALKEGGSGIVASENYGFSDTNVRAQITKIAAANPDVIVVMDFGTLLGSILKETQSLGIRDKVIANIGLLTAPPIDSKLLEGVRFAAPRFVLHDSKTFSEFSSEFRRRTGKGLTYDVIYTYDAFMMLVKGIKLAKGDMADVIPKIRAMGSYDGVSGRMVIHNDGNVSVEIAMGEYRSGRMKELQD